MSSPVERLRERLQRGEAVLLRAHGRAGGGLSLALQSFATALATHRDLRVEEWPVFPPSRRGGTVTAFVRAARGDRSLEPAAAAASGRAEVVVIADESLADEVGFAAETGDAVFVLDTALAPEQAAARWRLGGTVVTVDGAALGREHLGRPLSGPAVLSALAQAVGLEPQAVRSALRARLRERGQPDRVVEANLAILDEARARLRLADIPAPDAPPPRRRRLGGFGVLPAGAQTGLRRGGGRPEPRREPEGGTR